jgi:putative DNA primase/helicase
VNARFDSRHTELESELASKLARWAADNHEKIKNADPALPTTAHNRAADNWRPIFAIAEVVGADWPQRAVEAFTLLQNVDDAAQGLGTRLLGDIRDYFQLTRKQRAFSKDLVNYLVGMEEGPWSEIRKGKPITPTWLAGQLKPFKVFPSNIRIGETQGKGYALEDFADVFERFLPEDLQNRPTVPSPENRGNDSADEPSQGDRRDGRNNGEPAENEHLGRRDGPPDRGVLDAIDANSDEVLI